MSQKLSTWSRVKALSSYTSFVKLYLIKFFCSLKKIKIQYSTHCKVLELTMTFDSFESDVKQMNLGVYFSQKQNNI